MAKGRFIGGPCTSGRGCPCWRAQALCLRSACHPVSGRCRRQAFCLQIKLLRSSWKFAEPKEDQHLTAGFEPSSRNRAGQASDADLPPTWPSDETCFCGARRDGAICLCNCMRPACAVGLWGPSNGSSHSEGLGLGSGLGSHVQPSPPRSVGISSIFRISRLPVRFSEPVRQFTHDK